MSQGMVERGTQWRGWVNRGEERSWVDACKLPSYDPTTDAARVCGTRLIVRKLAAIVCNNSGLDFATHT